MRHFLVSAIGIIILTFVLQLNNEVRAVYESCSPPACQHNSCQADKLEQESDSATVQGVPDEWVDYTFKAECWAQVTCDDCAEEQRSECTAQDVVWVQVPGQETETSSCPLASATLGGTTCTCTEKATFTLTGESEY